MDMWQKRTSNRSTDRRQDSCGERGVALASLWGILNALLFAGCVFALRRIDISGNDLSSDGLTTITYSACRAILAFYVLGACLTLGALVLRVLTGDPRGHLTIDLPFTILSFFLGASVLGLVGTVIGLAGLLKLPIVVALIAPLVWLTPCYLGFHFRSRPDTVAATTHQNVVELSVQRTLVCCLIVLVAFSLVWKGLYPASAEADVWEHYLPYYRGVLETGSVGPNELWTHYWASKAAGLVHLVGVLSDEFSSQLVSWIFILMTAVIVIDLLASSLKSVPWATCGAIVFLSGVMTDPSIGAFMRHHAPAAAFVGFLVWATARILSSNSNHRKAVFASAVIVAFYAGLYLAQVVPLFAAFFCLLVAVASVLSEFRFAVRSIVTLLVATMVGMLTEFAISYVSTGVASFVSARVFWPFSDQEKFGRIVGDSGVLYLLYLDNDNPPLSEPWQWLARLFRIGHFFPLFAAALALTLVAVIQVRLGSRAPRPHQPTVMPAAVAGAFLLVSLVPPFLFRNESAMRLYLFLNLLFPVIVLSLVKLVTDRWSESFVKRACVASFLIGLSLVVVGLGVARHGDHLVASIAYVGGKLSTEKALKRTADVFGEPERFDFLQDVRKVIGLESKIFTLTYAPGPAGAFPRRGTMSEPLYTLGPDYLEMIFGTPERAAQSLRERGINYFHLSLDGKLFTGLAFSNLFRAQSLETHFKIAHQQRNQLLLTWRAPHDVERLPVGFAETLELKQKAVLVYPFESGFSEELQPVVETFLASTNGCGRERADLARNTECPIEIQQLARSVDRILRTRMPYEDLMPENTRSVQVILDDISRALTGSLPQRLPTLRDGVRSGAGSVPDYAGAVTRRVTTEVVTIVQIAVMNECIRRFGRPFCEPLTHRDERIPFGTMYQSKSSVANILKLKFTPVAER